MRHHRVVGTPTHNGVAKKMNQTLIDRARCMRSNARLRKDFWEEAVFWTTYLLNHFPSTFIELKTPKEMWYGNSPDYSNLKICGCPAYVHVNEEFSCFVTFAKVEIC